MSSAEEPKINEFIKRVASEATTVELGIIALGLSIGFIVGTILSAQVPLPLGLAAIGAGGWALIFAGTLFGIWRIVVGSYEMRNRRRGELVAAEEAQQKSLTEKQELTKRVESALLALHQESDAYMRQSNVAHTGDPRRRGSASPGNGLEAYQSVDQIRDELLSEYQLYLSGELSAAELEASRVKAVNDRKNVRKKFGLPQTDEFKRLQREVGGAPTDTVA